MARKLPNKDDYADEEPNYPKIVESRRDPVIVKAFAVKVESDSALNLERIEREIKILHESRTSRTLYKVALEPTKLAEASLRDMSCRARLSELKKEVFLQKMLLEAAFEACAAHLSTKYGEDLRQLASNATERKYLNNKVLSPLVSRIAELDATAMLLEIDMKDIDSAGFAIRNATEMMKLIYDSRGKVL